MTKSRDYYRMLSTRELIEEAKFGTNDEMVIAIIERLNPSDSYAHNERRLKQAHSDLANARAKINDLNKQIRKLTPKETTNV